jgi:hypothetical protein
VIVDAVDEPGLNALVERRAALTARLAVELDEGRLPHPPHVDEFDPQAERPSDPVPIFLSPMEALLLDIALAPAEPEQAWLTPAGPPAVVAKPPKSSVARLASAVAAPSRLAWRPSLREPS